MRTLPGIVLVCIVVATQVSCAAPIRPERGKVTPWQQEWSGYVGQTVIVEGRAERAKLGAIVTDRVENHILYVVGHDHWPGGELGRRVRITGTVIKQTDIPVYDYGKGTVEHDPADPRTWRFLLKDATWVVID
jgi:hypothetical protein